MRTRCDCEIYQTCELCAPNEHAEKTPPRVPQMAMQYHDGKIVEVEHKTAFGLLTSVGGLGK